jgi:hypothetical protein
MAKRISLILTAILLVYLGFTVLRGLDFLSVDDPAVQALGIAVLILPILGAILIYREIKFGKLSYLMGQTISDNYLPTNDLTDEQKRDYLDLAIERAKSQMENWQAWYSVALAYDLLKERKLAREAMKYSVELYQDANPK